MKRVLGRVRAGLIGGVVMALMIAGSGEISAQQPVEAQLQQLREQVEQLRQELAARDTVNVMELRRRIDLLTREIEILQLGEAIVQPDETVFGFAPAASKVYRIARGVSIGGYGELLYQNFSDERQDGAPSDRQDRFDALRAILYVGYKFSDRVIFNSELEWEHGSTGSGGEASIEFAYLDYFLTPSFGLRGGLLLAPMGLTNEVHEPPTFVGTTRPMVENAIIPSTWRANGVGFFGETAGFAYRGYALTSLDANRGFSASGLRGGRQKGANELAEDFSFIGRLDYTGVPSLLIGGSAHVGQTAHNRTVDGNEVNGTTTILEGHIDYSRFGLDVRAMYAVANVDDVVELNSLRDLTGSQSIGERLTGGFAEVGVDVLGSFEQEHQLIPYVRFETMNTQAEVPAGFTANPANERTAWLLGAMWKPVPEVALKADYQIHRNQADTGINQFNVNLSYLF